MLFRDSTGWLDGHPRSILALLSAVCLGLMSYGMYLQHVVGLIPCPMCIVQRYALVVIAIIAGLTALSHRKNIHTSGAILLVFSAGFGAFVAGRQSWLQWFPPEVATCGRDFYGMIEMFPLQRLVPMIFKGGGDCIKVDWTFLGGSIANWSFLCFVGIAILALMMAWRTSQARR